MSRTLRRQPKPSPSRQLVSSSSPSLRSQPTHSHIKGVPMLTVVMVATSTARYSATHVCHKRRACHDQPDVRTHTHTHDERLKAWAQYSNGRVSLCRAKAARCGRARDERWINCISRRSSLSCVCRHMETEPIAKGVFRRARRTPTGVPPPGADRHEKCSHRHGAPKSVRQRHSRTSRCS